MALTVEVKSDAVETRQGTSSRNNRPYTIRSQNAYITVYDAQGNKAPYPERISLNLDDNQQAYPVGTYLLDTDKCIYVGDFGRLMLGRPKLVPVKSSGLQAAA